MGFSDWIRIADTIGTLAGRLKSGVPATTTPPGAGALETRLAGVVVAALKEAFDRDRARMDLERSHVEAERRRAEEALAAELKRQAAERALGQLKLLAIIAIAMWMLSAALAVWLPGMRAGLPRTLLGAGWALSFAALGCTFAGFQHISAWTAAAATATELPRSAAASAAPWLLLGALASTAASLLAAL
jgi:hypothetical protein